MNIVDVKVLDNLKVGILIFHTDIDLVDKFDISNTIHVEKKEKNDIISIEMFIGRYAVKLQKNKIIIQNQSLYIDYKTFGKDYVISKLNNIICDEVLSLKQEIKEYSNRVVYAQKRLEKFTALKDTEDIKVID